MLTIYLFFPPKTWKNNFLPSSWPLLTDGSFKALLWLDNIITWNTIRAPSILHTWKCFFQMKLPFRDKALWNRLQGRFNLWNLQDVLSPLMSKDQGKFDFLCHDLFNVAVCLVSVFVKNQCLSLLLFLSDALRRILCQVGLQRGPEGENSSLVDTLMLCDSKMWKGEWKSVLCADISSTEILQHWRNTAQWMSWKRVQITLYPKIKRKTD